MLMRDLEQFDPCLNYTGNTACNQDAIIQIRQENDDVLLGALSMENIIEMPRNGGRLMSPDTR